MAVGYPSGFPINAYTVCSYFLSHVCSHLISEVSVRSCSSEDKYWAKSCVQFSHAVIRDHGATTPLGYCLPPQPRAGCCVSPCCRTLKQIRGYELFSMGPSLSVCSLWSTTQGLASYRFRWSIWGHFQISLPASLSSVVSIGHVSLPDYDPAVSGFASGFGDWAPSWLCITLPSYGTGTISIRNNWVMWAYLSEVEQRLTQGPAPGEK